MDEQTIQRAREGDRPAREALLREYQDPWFRFCLSMLRDEDAARDATQETALRFLRTLGDFRGHSSLLTWSMGIAINVVREWRRKSRRFADDGAGGEQILQIAHDDAIRGGASSSSANTSSPLESASRSEAQEMLRGVLHELPDRQREAVTLRFFEDLSVEETAAAMKCATGTVKATVHQALRALRSKLKAMN